jgi:hypothetical protein
VLRTLPGRGGPGRLRPLTAADLRRHDLGRSQRVVSPALRDLLGTIDGERCRFPGCTRRKTLHAHHVVHWRDGGTTDLENLVLVCSRHHTLLHSAGFGLVLHPDRRLDVRTSGGVPSCTTPLSPGATPRRSTRPAASARERSHPTTATPGSTWTTSSACWWRRRRDGVGSSGHGSRGLARIHRFALIDDGLPNEQVPSYLGR